MLCVFLVNPDEGYKPKLEYIYILIYKYVCMYIYVCMYVYMYVYIYIYMFIYLRKSGEGSKPRHHEVKKKSR